MALKEAYPLRLLCRAPGVPRSTLYYRSNPIPRRRSSEAACPLRREGFGVGEKRVRSLLGLEVTGFQADLSHVVLGPRLSQGPALAALGMALREGCPEVHHSDRGVQYTSRAYVERLLGPGVRLSYAGTGRPFRTVKEAWVDLREHRTLEAARASVEAFVFEVYNRRSFCGQPVERGWEPWLN